MLYSTLTPADKRANFRAALDSGKLQLVPGAFNPLRAKLIQDR